MDRVINGRIDRVGCEEGEEACDVCWRNKQMDLLGLQLLEWSPKMVHFSQEGLLRLEREGSPTSNVEFGDSGISKSMSSTIKRVRQSTSSRLISKD